MKLNKNSYISDSAKIGENVTIQPFSVIHDDVIIGDNTVIGSNSIIGIKATNDKSESNLTIGANSIIRSGSVIYSNSFFDDNLMTGHNVIIREGIKAGRGVLVGSNCELEGWSSIGSYTKIHSFSFIPRKTQIGNFVWLFPRFQGSTDPLPPSNIERPIMIKDMAVVGINSLITSGVTIGIGSFVGAASIVTSDVEDTHCVKGNPAKFFTRIDRLINFEHKLRHPWPLHNRESYPKESYVLMDKILNEINEIIDAQRKH